MPRYKPCDQPGLATEIELIASAITGKKTNT